MKNILKKYNLDKKKIIVLFHERHSFISKIINELFIYSCNKNLKELNIKLTDFLLLVPLPTYFKVYNFNDVFIKIKDRYSMMGEPKNRIILGNICLPYHEFSSIPFIFVYKYNDKIYKKISNVFYYEITIDKEPFRQPWNNEAISIGYGSINTYMNNNHVGWSKTSYGYHNDDGKIYSNNTSKYDNQKFGKGDTIGAGLIYLDSFKYEIFFTLNGKLLENSIIFTCVHKLTIMIGLNLSSSIKLNIGNDNFLYNIENHIKPNVVSTNNNFINYELDMSNYKYICRRKKIEYQWTNAYIEDMNQEGDAIIENIQNNVEHIENLLDNLD